MPYNKDNQPQLKKVKSFKCVFRGTSPEEKTSFKDSKCLLTISVGQEAHEGEYFRSTIELINQSFQSCVILVDDSLQRHTMALTEPQDADYFYQTSIQLGDLWLERSAAVYGALNIPYIIMRWDHWLQHELWQSTRQQLMQALASDQYYAQAVNASVDEFLRRYTSRLPDGLQIDMQRARQLCMDYLLEECSALCLWPELNCNYEVYPSARNSAMAETHARFVLPRHPQLLHAVALKFKSRKQFSAQALGIMMN